MADTSIRRAVAIIFYPQQHDLSTQWAAPTTPLTSVHDREAGGKPAKGFFCRIRNIGDRNHPWELTTGEGKGRRYLTFATFNQAATAARQWAKQRYFVVVSTPADTLPTQQALFGGE